MEKYKISYSGCLEFEFIGERNEYYLEGKFSDWNNNIKKKLMELDDENDWYLDKNGYRLNDKELFNSSPWMLIGKEGIQTKVVLRIFDSVKGEAKYALKPWFRIADELNNPV